jgi:hypothetical protein
MYIRKPCQCPCLTSHASQLYGTSTPGGGLRVSGSYRTPVFRLKSDEVRPRKLTQVPTIDHTAPCIPYIRSLSSCTIPRTMLIQSLSLRQLPSRASLTTLRLVRLASTTTPPAPPPPPRQPVSPTTFSEKSSPRNVHDRPEQIRGFPPSRKSTTSPQAATTDGDGPLTEHGAAGHKWTSNVVEEEAFDGPSRPRLLYSRQPRRDLPSFGVSCGTKPRHG